jgi:hypothetical protein
MQARRLDKGLCDDEARQIYKTLIRIFNYSMVWSSLESRAF